MLDLNRPTGRVFVDGNGEHWTREQAVYAYGAYQVHRAELGLSSSLRVLRGA